MKRKVTIRDVAQAAGVSLGTASRALNRTGRVSEATVASVTKTARRLGYEPDVVARSLRTRSSGVVGLLISDMANPFYAGVISAVEAELQAAGYALLIANTHNDAKRQKALIDLYRSHRVDGLILGPCLGEDVEQLAQLQRDGPVVVLDRELGPGDSGVHVDHYHGALQATRYLLNLGHTRIALMTTGRELRPGRERLAAFEEAHRERGLEPVAKLVRTERSSMEFAFSEALALLSLPEPPTAFLCLGTRILAGALHAIRHAGRSVPGDASVVSIGDTDLSQLFTPAITSLTWDLDAVGHALAERLLRQLGAESAHEPERIVMTTQLVLRESCAPLKPAVVARKKAVKP